MISQNKAETSNIASSLGIFIGRIMISLLFFSMGFSQIVNFGETCRLIKVLGFPFESSICVLGIMLNLTGGIFLMLGYKYKVGILFLMIVIAPSTFLFHFSYEQQINFLRNMAVFGGLISLSAMGPGKFSIGNSGRRK